MPASSKSPWAESGSGGLPGPGCFPGERDRGFHDRTRFSRLRRPDDAAERGGPWRFNALSPKHRSEESFPCTYKDHSVLVAPTRSNHDHRPRSTTHFVFIPAELIEHFGRVERRESVNAVVLTGSAKRVLYGRLSEVPPARGRAYGPRGTSACRSKKELHGDFATCGVIDRALSMGLGDRRRHVFANALRSYDRVGKMRSSVSRDPKVPVGGSWLGYGAPCASRWGEKRAR